jgi:kinesin family protein C1
MSYFVNLSTLHTSYFVDALCMMQVCIFAYGQTGSGKTHTMLGNPDIPDEGGVIPRSLEQVFQTSQSLSAQGWSFRMQVCTPRIHCIVLRTDNFRLYLVCIQLGEVCDYTQWFILNSTCLFLMQASMLEIYNETIRDLLVKGPVNGDAKQMYVVKHDVNGNTSVSDLTLVDVTNWKEVSNLLHRASQLR